MPMGVRQTLLTMKVTFLCMLLFCLQSRGTTSAQTITIKATDMSLKDVLEQVRKQTGYSVLFTSDVEESGRRVTLQTKDMPLDEFLTQLLDDQASFSIREQTIFIKPGKQENALPRASSQNVIRGRVVNNEGEGMAGVNVRIKGQSAYTTTDENGNFAIRAGRGSVLTFSYVGYTAAEQTVESDTPLHVVMRTDETNLDEVVVVGYGTVRKSDLTGSVSSVKLAENNENRVISVPEALQGRVAGVNILNNTGEPGSGMTFNIRGTTSITGSNQPLIVLDGQPIESDLSATNAGMSIDWQSESPPLDPLASLNPADIESVEILKDASATAIYGSRGANGVVLITTKRGKSKDDRDQISYSVRSDFSRLPKKIPMADAYTYMLYRNEAAMNEGRGPVYSDQEIEENVAIYGNLNWQDMVYRTAQSMDHQLTASGLLGKSTYRLSANYSNNENVLRNADFRRGSVRFNFDRDISKKLSVSFRSNLSYTHRKYGAQSNTQGTFSSSAVIGAIASTPLRMPYTEDGELEIGFANNPVLVTELLKDHTNSETVISSLDLEYKIIKGLSYKIKGAVNQISSLRQLYWPRGTFQGNQYDGSATRATNVNSNYLIDHLLTYKRNLDKHRINAVAGYSYQQWFRKGSSVTSTGFPTDLLGYENMGMAELPGITYTTHQNRALQSVLGRVNYSFDNRYLLTLTGRYDGATRLAPGNKWSFFPSVGLGWNVSNEPFFKANLPAINNLKIRASYGVAGSENIAIGATQGRYTIDHVIIGDRIVPGFNYANFSNALLGWETTKSLNLGVDLGILKDRVTLSADVYQKTTNDLLLNLSIPASSTFRSYSTNTGEVSNKGVDVEANVIILRNKTWDWSAFGNVSINRNKIVDMGGTDILYGGIYLNGGNSFLNQSLQVAKVGEAISSFWGYRTAGIYQNPLEIESDPNIRNDPNKASIRPGDVRFVDVNGDGQITDADKTIIGKPNPNFSVGFGSSVSYKQLTFSFTFIGNFGQQLINLNQWLIGSLTNLGTYNVSMDAFNNRWRGEGTSNKYPRPNLDNLRFGGKFPDYMIEDASFLRLQNVNLGYDFSLPGLLKSARFRTYISGTNLFTITNYLGYDPNVNALGNQALMSGVDFGTLPQSRTFSMGLILTY